MKKLLISFLFFVALMLLYSQCQESDGEHTVTDPELIGQARQYFESLRPPQRHIVDAKFARDKTVMWEEAYVKETSAGKAVFAPMRYVNPLTIANSLDEQRYYAFDNLTNLVIYQDDRKAFRAEQIVWLPDAAYQGLDAPFTGVLKVHDLEGNLLKAYRYQQDGTVQKLVVREKGVAPSGREQVISFQICVTTYGHNYSEADPIGYYWSETTCTIFEIDDGGGWGSDPGGPGTGPGGPDYGGGGSPGGGGGNPGPGPCTPTPARMAALDGPPLTQLPPKPCITPVPVPINPEFTHIIFVDVTDPCLSESVSDFLGSGSSASTEMAALFGTGELTSLYIRQGSVTDADGHHDWAKTSKSVSGDYTSITITLDKSKLTNTTKEWIAATLIHEAYHAYYDITNGANSGNEASHNLMSTPEMMSLMSHDLMGMFPGMSLETAMALTWVGLEGSTGYGGLSAADRTQQANLARDYKYGAKGAACP